MPENGVFVVFLDLELVLLLRLDMFELSCLLSHLLVLSLLLSELVLHLHEIALQGGNMLLFMPELVFQALVVHLLLLKHLLQLCKRLRGLSEQVLALLSVRVQLDQLVLVTVVLLLKFVLLFAHIFQFAVDLSFAVKKFLLLAPKSVQLLARVRSLRLDLMVLELQFLDLLFKFFVLSNLFAHVLSELTDGVL